MADFKIDAKEALFANLSAMQYAYESYTGRKSVENQELFRELALYMPIVKIDKGIYYRARIIKNEDGEKTGIIRENGIPVRGYNIQYSGVPPEYCVKDNGRVNRKGEPVLYIAEDEETSCKEEKPKKTDYLSVSECIISSDINVMDLTITVSKGLDNIFTEDVVQLFHDKYAADIRVFYMNIRNYFTSPNFKDLDYTVTLDFLDRVKQRKDISGIKYNSYFTQKCNIALWDDYKNSKCINSKVKTQITL